MTNVKKEAGKISCIITTFGGDIYIINGKTPDEVQDLIDAGGDMVRMPNGARVHRKGIATIQDYHDYAFQTDQKSRHKKNQFLKSGEWHDHSGSLGISSHLERITGEMPKNLLPGKKPLVVEEPQPEPLQLHGK
jgi:hypothetical protein